MTPLGWVLLGAGAYCALLLFVGALCAVAKDADAALERRDRERGVVYEWHVIAHDDTGLATWAFVTVDPPETERDLGDLAERAAETG